MPDLNSTSPNLVDQQNVDRSDVRKKYCKLFATEFE